MGRTMTDARYIVAREWGFGFWSDMGHILSVLLIAEITGRIPVIHWGNNWATVICFLKQELRPKINQTNYQKMRCSVYQH